MSDPPVSLSSVSSYMSLSALASSGRERSESAFVRLVRLGWLSGFKSDTAWKGVTTFTDYSLSHYESGVWC